MKQPNDVSTHKRESLSAYMPVDLAIGIYAVELETLNSVAFPQFAGSTLRGAFNWAFKRMVCYQPKVKQCDGCLLREQCPYPQVFEPKPKAGSLHAQLDRVPLPYVLRPPIDGKRHYDAGEHITFEVVLIGRALRLLPYFAVALQEMRLRGVGGGGGRVRVVRISALEPDAGPADLYDLAEPEMIRNHAGRPAWAWIGDGEAPTVTTVEFQTPTRLKSRGAFKATPDFDVLYRAILRRASAMSMHHSDTAWETDFPSLALGSRRIRTAAIRTERSKVNRYSSRQQQRIELWGCEGIAVYEGDLGRYWPLLQLGQVLHVGKACSFGMGRYRLLG